jgi:uncharacterized membrane protein (UPF0127 family)
MGNDRTANSPRPFWVLFVAGVLVLAGLVTLTWAVLLRDGRAPGVPRPAGGALPPPATSGIAPAAYELRPSSGTPVRVRLEVAATPDQRQRGLMERTRVADGTGMVFLFPDDTDSGFWMKDTLVPLSIAFVDAGGRVVAVREMTPCHQDPCPVYRPGATYRSAVELGGGAFTEAGIKPGDSVVPLTPGALPEAS